MIGIAISTHNRNQQLTQTLAQINKYRPPNSIVIVVDDASDMPCKEANFRFETNVGIARVKNKCIELLYDKRCTEFFLFDDDSFPIVDKWWEPYINSPEPHMMYIFKEFANGNNKLNDTLLLYEDSQKKCYSHARGCMLYYKKICFNTVGGMNPDFGRWGFDHSDLSQRIYNAGLTSFKFMDVQGSNKLIYSMDEHLEIKSTTYGIERIKLLNKYRELFNQSRLTKNYYDFRPQEDVFITTYFTQQKDPQRDKHFKNDKAILQSLIKTLKGQKLIILNDCFGEDHVENNVHYIKTQTSINPYFQRWISIQEHLKVNNYRKVFIIDATDVLLLNNPFDSIKSEYIYVGDEENIVGCSWMFDNHKAPRLQEFFEQYKNEKLLNAGLLGGERKKVEEFISHILNIYWEIQTEAHFSKQEDSGVGDMGVFNYVCYILYKGKLKHGRLVNTPFKSFTKQSRISWFAHK